MRHNRTAMNIARLLVDRLAGSPCQMFREGFMLHVPAPDSVYYPDVFVYCGSAVATDAKLVHDDSIVVEVPSDSTGEIDRREKLVAYCKLQGLRAYWVVSQDEHRVEVHDRADRGRSALRGHGHRLSLARRARRSGRALPRPPHPYSIPRVRSAANRARQASNMPASSASRTSRIRFT